MTEFYILTALGIGLVVVGYLLATHIHSVAATAVATVANVNSTAAKDLAAVLAASNAAAPLANPTPPAPVA